MQIEAKLRERGLVLPEAPRVPPGITISFAWTRRHGNRVYVSGHAAQNPDGSPAGPFGKVPTEVSLEAAWSTRSQAMHRPPTSSTASRT
jgi:hypothetical protein